MVGTLTVSEDAAAAPAGAATPAGAPAEAPQELPPSRKPRPLRRHRPRQRPRSAASHVDIVAYDIYFEPKEVTIPANTDVTVMLRERWCRAAQLLDRRAWDRHRPRAGGDEGDGHQCPGRRVRVLLQRARSQRSRDGWNIDRHRRRGRCRAGRKRRRSSAATPAAAAPTAGTPATGSRRASCRSGSGRGR